MVRKFVPEEYLWLPKYFRACYVVILVFGLLATVTCMVTPVWRHYTFQDSDFSVGLFTSLCHFGNDTLILSSNKTVDYCDNRIGGYKHTYEKIILFFLLLALFTELSAFALAIYSCFVCCWIQCPVNNFHPPLAASATIFLVVACLEYLVPPGVDDIEYRLVEYLGFKEGEIIHRYGYSFWSLVAAISIMLFATIFGCAAAIAYLPDETEDHFHGD